MNIITMPLGVCRANCYIVWNDGDTVCTVIDPADRADIICGKVKELGLSVGAILLTHAHYDHIAGLEKLKELTCAPVYLGREEKKALYDGRYNLSTLFTGRELVFSQDAQALCDGDVVNVGSVVFKVLETPGHTEGSVCYLAEGELFTGDTLFSGTIGRTDFPGGDFGEIMKSLSRLLALDGNINFHPGHEAGGKISYEKENNPYA